jgi:hypothetical protein|tara:strand:+ start:367 stop:837 length:471 start_codon:yes stop_codon:yes gene_type:complete
MAHFAELDRDDNIIRVIVVGNDIDTGDGPLGENDMHTRGEIWCEKFFKGGIWKQTSYNRNFRKNFAAINGIYIRENDIFSRPRTHESWVLNRTTGEWDPPIARPTIKTGILDGIEYNYRGWWDEESQSFKAHLGQTNIYEWNTEILSWDLITVQAP